MSGYCDDCGNTQCLCAEIEAQGGVVDVAALQQQNTDLTAALDVAQRALEKLSKLKLQRAPMGFGESTAEVVTRARGIATEALSQPELTAAAQEVARLRQKVATFEGFADQFGLNWTILEDAVLDYERLRGLEQRVKERLAFLESEHPGASVSHGLVGHEVSILKALLSEEAQ